MVTVGVNHNQRWLAKWARDWQADQRLVICAGKLMWPHVQDRYAQSIDHGGTYCFVGAGVQRHFRPARGEVKQRQQVGAGFGHVQKDQRTLGQILEKVAAQNGAGREFHDV